MSSLLLSDLLKKRFVADFMREMKKLGADRSEVLSKAVEIVEITLADGDISAADFESNGTTIKQYAEYHLSEALNEVFDHE